MQGALNNTELNVACFLTRCVSSAGMLKLQVLDVDLEILLLSFFV